MLRVKGRRSTPALDPKARVALLVSEDHALARDLSRALHAGGFRVESTRTAGNALNRLRKARADLLVLDARFLREGDYSEIARAVPLRRVAREQERIHVGKLTLDPASRVAHVSRRQVQLTSTECSLLLELIRHRSSTVTRDELLDSLGDHGRVFDRTIDRHICNLRRKLEPTPKASSIIVTVHGIGYRLNLRT
ncbi:MAG TPA: winged helix-turn-helix domain-containing protein [Candidatus Binatia bacterium]|nr:winged helix-turn-helix domain-containing protein [Candidatus Binatia bacterium]